MLLFLLSLVLLLAKNDSLAGDDLLVTYTTSNQTEVSVYLEFESINGYEMATIQGGELIDLTYIKNVVTTDEAKQ